MSYFVARLKSLVLPERAWGPLGDLFKPTTNARSVPKTPPALSDSMKATALVGWTIIFVFFGVFGLWAKTAPLNGAVVANGVIKVDGNRKSVQHLDGGIIQELRVKEGDHVKAGDILLVLDGSQARAEYD